LDGFSFALLNIKEQKYIAIQFYDIQNCSNYGEVAENIDQIISQQDLLQQNFSSTSICICNSLNTLTPKALYEKENGKEILRFNQALLQNENETNDWLQSIQAFNSYTLPQELQRCFNKHYPNQKWKHQSSILIESLLQQFKLNEEVKIYLSVENTAFEIIVLDGRKLKFFNSYTYRSAEDVIYYLLFACEQLGLNPDQIPVVISGEIEESSEVYKLLYRYVRNLSFIKRNPNYNYSFVLDQVPEHYYYKLLNIHLCAS
tara:strand:- start:134 stop:910 length:777 start_codon:yes stop_codon:yes gene_type:complete